jgi:molybdopterin biosynthesis enzyme MoaB
MIRETKLAAAQPLNGFAQQFRAVFEVAQGSVAILTEDAAYFCRRRGVIRVNLPASFCAGIIRLAYAASATLCRKQSVLFFDR